MEKVHPDDVEKVKRAISASFQTGSFESEFQYTTADSEKFILSRGEVFFDQDKRLLTLVGTVQDITERKRIEENLIKQALELQHSNKQLQEFAYVTSHDLKEPLRKISLYLDIILTSER